MSPEVRAKDIPLGRVRSLERGEMSKDQRTRIKDWMHKKKR